MKKRILCLVLSIVMCASLCIPAVCATGEPAVKNYSTAEIQEYAQNYVDQLWMSHYGSAAKSKPSGMGPKGSFYTEVLHHYEPDMTVIKHDAFPLQTFTYDRSNQPTGSVTVTYTQGQAVEWTISGQANGQAEFNLIQTKVTAELGVSVARTASTSSGCSSTCEYILPGGGKYSITIYAHGVATTGGMVYYWTDITGRSGYDPRPMSALLPYAQYSQTSGIHFGPLESI